MTALDRLAIGALGIAVAGAAFAHAWLTAGLLSVVGVVAALTVMERRG